MRRAIILYRVDAIANQLNLSRERERKRKECIV